jgi:hypothetical protein
MEDRREWRRFKGACSNYREHWSPVDEPGDEGCRLLYQVICLLGTPPLTLEEQQRCLRTVRGCWRLPESDPQMTQSPVRSARFASRAAE